MHRNEFLKTCAGGCFLTIGLGALGSVVRAAEFSFRNDKDEAQLLTVSKDRFLKKKKKEKEEEIKKQNESEVYNQGNDTTRSHSLSHSDSSYRPYVILDDSPYEWPIVLYRFSDTEYSAMLMRCTHQGSELSAHGEIMTCSAHGSEFDTRGQVITGPAENPLQTFEVSTDETNVYIHLL